MKLWAEMNLIELFCFIPALWHCGSRIRAEYRHRPSELFEVLLWFDFRFDINSVQHISVTIPVLLQYERDSERTCAVKRTWKHYFATRVSTPAYLMSLIRPERVPRKAVSTPGSTLQDTRDIVLLWVRFLIILTEFYLSNIYNTKLELSVWHEHFNWGKQSEYFL